jgi:hypothetical protein
VTSDEELIERLRRTLRAEAAALRPNPQEYPLSEPSGGRVLPFRARWPLAVVAVAAATPPPPWGWRCRRRPAA